MDERQIRNIVEKYVSDIVGKITDMIVYTLPLVIWFIFLTILFFAPTYWDFIKLVYNRYPISFPEGLVIEYQVKNDIFSDGSYAGTEHTIRIQPIVTRIGEPADIYERINWLISSGTDEITFNDQGLHDYKTYLKETFYKVPLRYNENVKFKVDSAASATCRVLVNGKEFIKKTSEDRESDIDLFLYPCSFKFSDAISFMEAQ